MDEIDWDEVDRNNRSRFHRAYQQRQCPLCGKVISESAYSGRDGNWRKHARSCQKKREASQ